MDTKELARKLKTLRTQRGFSQEELAERVGISYQQVQKYEKGDTRLTLERLYAFAQALNVPLEELLSSTLSHLSEAEDTYAIVEPHSYRLTEEEVEFIKLFRRVKNRKIREAVIHLLKGAREDE